MRSLRSRNFVGGNHESRTTDKENPASQPTQNSRITAGFSLYSRITSSISAESQITQNPFQTLYNVPFGLCLHGAGSKWIRSENRIRYAFCLHGTILEPVRNGSKQSVGTRLVLCKHQDQFRQTLPCKHKLIQSDSVQNHSGPVLCKGPFT